MLVLFAVCPTPLPVKLLNLCLTLWQETIKTNQTRSLKVQTQSHTSLQILYTCLNSTAMWNEITM